MFVAEARVSGELPSPLLPGAAPQSGPLRDRRGRVARKLRLSLTDRCHFSCVFCMPERGKVQWIPREEILDFDEIVRIVRLLALDGVEKVRLTGGEPLLRPGVADLLRRLKGLPGLREIDMTTNGERLPELARELREAGLDGITVSLHSLQRERFAQLAGLDVLPRVLEGIESALRVGFPVKINAVAIRGYNEEEIPALVEYARERSLPLRFIEFMPLDGRGNWDQGSVLTGAEILATLRSSHPLTPLARESGDTARRYRLEGSDAEVGLITPVSEPFCDDCDRIRLTADGKLLTCLFDTHLHDVRGPLRAGASDEELRALLRRSYEEKPPGIQYIRDLQHGFQKPRPMHAIGG